MAQVNVTIAGRTYRMACDDGQEEHLLGLADRLNRTIEDLRGAFGEIGDQRLTVMAAITMTDQLAEAQRQIARLEGEVRALHDRGSAAEQRSEAAEAGIARAISSAAQRIARAAARLDADIPRS